MLKRKLLISKGQYLIFKILKLITIFYYTTTPKTKNIKSISCFFKGMGSIQAECKKCGGKANADNFKLDYKARLMVCPNCFNQRDNPSPKVGLEQKKVKQERVEPSRPPGWDKEDVELERLNRIRIDETRALIERVPGQTYVKLTCPECKFKYKYYPINKKPGNCPYCNKESPKIRITGVF